MFSLQMPKRSVYSTHLATFFLCIIIGYVTHRCESASPPATKDASHLASQLAHQSKLLIDDKSIKWIPAPPSPGLFEALSWHTLVFLARTDEASPADFYRIDVKTTDGDTLYAARNLLNLSHSPAGDEFEISVFGSIAAVKNRVLDQVRSVTLFDFGTDLEIEGPSTALTRFLGKLTNQLEDGQLSGIERTAVRFSEAPSSVNVQHQEDNTLALTWENAAGTPHHATVTPGSEQTDSNQIVVTKSVKLEKRPVLWMVDTVRSFSWIGPGPIEWAEGRFFALKDFLKRTRYRMVGDSEDAVSSDEEEAPTAVLELPEGIEIGSRPQGEQWPPPPFDPPVFKRPIAGEGTWKPIAPEFVRTLPNAPPAFYKSITRPDASRPYVKVHLFAMDMRQLSVHMVGGYEDPKSTTGSSGTGRLPRKKAVLERVVGAFNGAFKTMHGAYGMMVEKNVLLPPKDDAATVASLADGTTVMGTWPQKTAIPPQMRSYRQNMDPLIEGEVVNPKRRYLWGFTLDEDITKMQTIRSGICMSEKGYMLYAWGEDLTAQTLGRAMIAGGCSYGLHLDMNPFHTSYIFYHFETERYEDGDRPEFEAKVALSGMRYSPHRYVNGAPKDFFYLMLRDSAPGPEWSAEGLAQPVPAAVPALFRRETDGCALVALDLTRSHGHLAHGEYPDYLSPAGEAGEPPHTEDLLLDITLGPWSSVRGQLSNSSVLATLRAGKGTLGVRESGELTLAPWPLAPAFKEAIQGDTLTRMEADKTAIALSIHEKWLIVGVGKVGTLKKEFARYGRPIGFSSTIFTPDKHHIAVRTATGMADLSGDQLNETDTAMTHLKLFATPKFLGAKRLENLGEPRNPSTDIQKEK